MLAIFATAAVFADNDSPAFAAETGSVALTPVTVDSDVNYHYFDDPVSVFADDSGLLVCDGDGIKTISKSSTTDKYFVEPDGTYAGIAADKAFRTDGTLYTLENGVIHARSDGDALFEYPGVISDFDIDGAGGKLYAVSNDKIVTAQIGGETEFSDYTVTALYSAEHPRIDASAIAATKSGIYVATDSALFKNKQDICSVSEHGELNVILRTDSIYSMTAADGEAVLYTLTRDRLTGYTVSGGGLAEKFSTDGASIACVYAHGEYVYALDSLNALHAISTDLKTDSVMFAAASGADGFFYMPTGAAVKKSTLFVADSMNGRVAEYGNSSVLTERIFNNPVSVACDSSGTLYVAHSYNEIGIFTADGKFSRAITLNESGVTVKQILVDSEKRLYILANNGLWLSENGGVPVNISATAYKAIALGIGHESVYALGDSNVYKFEAVGDSYTEKDYCEAPSDSFSLTVDLDGSVYLLSPDGISCAKKNGDGKFLRSDITMTLDGKRYSLGFSSGQILLSTVQNAFVNYGDVVIVDTFKHRIFSGKIDCEGFEPKLIDGDYKVPDKANDNTPENHADGLIRTALFSAEVYSLPMETQPIFTIEKGKNVIVAEYETADSREYSLVLFDDGEDSKLKVGYVYKSALSAPLPYSDPPSKVGTVYNNSTPVYKYPSPKSPLVKGYEAVNRDRNFEMLSFVDSFTDEYGNLWYRLEIDGNYEGFIFASNFSLNGYEPNFIRPAYNAEIVEYKGVTVAKTYSDSGKTELTVTLPAGTKVEVVGAYDSSAEYTKIKYLDPERGTLTCYVKTAHIKYEGVNIVLIVAIAIMLVTIILALIIVARVRLNKKRRFKEQ